MNDNKCHFSELSDMESSDHNELSLQEVADQLGNVIEQQEVYKEFTTFGPVTFLNKITCTYEIDMQENILARYHESEHVFHGNKSVANK